MVDWLKKTDGLNEEEEDFDPDDWGKYTSGTIYCNPGYDEQKFATNIKNILIQNMATNYNLSFIGFDF